MITLQIYITKENLQFLTLCHPATIKDLHMDTQTNKETTQTKEILHQILYIFNIACCLRQWCLHISVHEFIGKRQNTRFMGGNHF